MLKRKAGCPLCGANMGAVDLLNACTEFVDFELGVLSGRCPHCQGYLEVLPTDGRVDIGYTVGTDSIRFDAAVSLPCAGLVLERSESPPGMVLKDSGRRWEFWD